MQLSGKRDAVLPALASPPACRSGDALLPEPARKGFAGPPRLSATIYFGCAIVECMASANMASGGLLGVDLVPRFLLRAGPISLLAKFGPSGRWRGGNACLKGQIMTTEAVRAQSAGAERLRGLVARWQNLAEFRDRDGRANRTGWAEHLRRVADENEKQEEESNPSNDSPKPVGPSSEEKLLVDQDNSHAFLRPTLRPPAP